MKSIVFIVGFTALLAPLANCQSVADLNLKRADLIKKRNVLSDSIQYFDNLVSTIQYVESKSNHKISCVVSSPTQVTECPEAGNLFLGFLNTGDSITIYNLTGNNYLIRSNGIIGLIPKSSVDQTKPIQKYNKVVAKENKKKVKEEISTNSSSYHQSTKSYSSGSSFYSGSKAIHTGPRGGQYYINKNGNKTYVKKKH
jgi:hypothetical protein